MRFAPCPANAFPEHRVKQGLTENGNTKQETIQ
jgi:hypothetical protein